MDLSMKYDSISVTNGKELRMILRILGLSIDKAAEVLEVENHRIPILLANENFNPAMVDMIEELIKEYIEEHKDQLQDDGVLDQIFRTKTTTTTYS